jgi:hypothetical protein
MFFVFGAQSCASKKNTSIINEISIQKKSNDKVIENNLLYIIDGKVVLSDFVKNIETIHIEFVMVIKGEKKITKYTNKEYDGVTIIKMKK